jgi:UPF0755 protein
VKKFLVLLLLLCLVLVAGVALQGVLFVSSRASDSTEEIVFEVIPGASLKKICHILQDKALITSALKFEIYSRLSSSKRVRTGEYLLKKNMTPKEILSILASGKSIEYALTVPEGYNKWEIAALLRENKLASSEEFLKLVSNKSFIKELLGEEEPSLEGYLFPETYYLTKYTGAKGLIKAMVSRFLEVYPTVTQNPQIHMTRHEHVILASIIEKETGAENERPQVSSVFFNRTHIKMKLQTDPTVIYGILDSGKKYDGNIHRVDLETPTRYNTYTNYGFPFGPISNPGRSSLEAAVHPAQTDFLFFVSRNDGTHVFSKDLKAHVAAVGKFQLDPKARTGKSWRDLKKTPQAATIKK